MIDKICEECGARFLVRRYRAGSARFCSQRCGGAWHARTRLNSRVAIAMRAERMKGNKYRAGLAPAHAFAPGHAPWNKGVKGLHLSPGSEFKPGREAIVPIKPIGAVRVRKDKQGALRAYVKTAQPNKWMPRARFIWEKIHGPIPAGMVIHHRDRDPLNDVIGNLSLLTRSEHLAEHRTDLSIARERLEAESRGLTLRDARLRQQSIFDQEAAHG